jgi:hypothetical protein
MKPDELKDKIDKEEVGISDILSAIAEDNVKIYPMTLTAKKKKIKVTMLEHGEFFNDLAVKYSKEGLFEKSEMIFEAMLKKTPKDQDTMTNFGTMVINMAINLYKQGKALDRLRLEKARKLIFKANKYFKEVHEDWWIRVPYANLRYLRAIEATYYYNQNDSFASFVLGWMSIEMTLNQIWFIFIRSKITQGLDKLMKWNTERIVETLLLCENEIIRNEKSNLDKLRGIRNNLLHGKKDNPTMDDAKLCIDTALSLQRYCSELV